MINFKKKNLNVALTTALVVAGLAGFSQQAQANMPNTGATVTGDAYVSNNQLGQALIFPYYTTRGNKKSIINLFNTSNKAVAVKVRFHESHNSRDVLDFTLVMSAYDKWAGTVEEAMVNGVERPVFTTNDNSCTAPAVPAAGVPLNEEAYSLAGYADADSDQTTDRLREGYIEVIAMGDAYQGVTGTVGATKDAPLTAAQIAAGTKGNTAYYATHIDAAAGDADQSRKPRDCATVVKHFENTVDNFPSTAVSAANISGNPLAQTMFEGLEAGDNPLRGALTIISETDGVGFGASAVAIADFSAHTAAAPVNLISAQTPPYFLEPTLASANGLWTTTGLANIEQAMAASQVVNEWAHNPLNGADTDWILQFPTKGFHVDIPYVTNATKTGCKADNVQAARNVYRGNLLPAGCVAATGTGVAGYTEALSGATIAPFEERFGPQGSPLKIVTKIIDKEEGTIAGASGVVFSPSIRSYTSIPYESNVITFSGAGGTSVLSSNSPEIALDPTASLKDTNGLAMISFSSASGASGAIPVVGFVAKQRNQGNSSLNFGQIMKHSYK